MHDNSILYSIFLIFCGAAALSTVALYTRQSLLVAYMLLGVLLGPSGLGLIADASMVREIGDVGIIFLMFLLGLNLQPQNLLHMFKKTTWIAIISSIVFALTGYIVARLFHFSQIESMIVGGAMMFSSTIIGLKLLPTTILHHQHTGEIMISILLMQDLIAIILLLVIHASTRGLQLIDLGLVSLSLPALILFAFLFERFVLLKLFARFDRVREYMFLLSIAWCLGVSELASMIGLSREIGAFIAGVSIASSPIALYIAESLKPIRDFFLVMFFFAVGASFNLKFFPEVAIPAMILGGSLLLIKPIAFSLLLRSVKETRHVAWEVGMRLGQSSEFSLLIGYLAASLGLINAAASNLIQAATMITFVASSYIIVMKFPTPVAASDRLRRD
ncbi:MAG: cation:proton antiporter [Gammaproteobacteria bacterium]|nr:cation:proton antiporter [Gammaproteobacteria bacterium]